ncbi:excalibur calcium-binding domain-containing protein [Amycolatopsis roodepoortensis]|uniref:thermonuclease family protein n=1 Tax=Amycolatopsis roodepoortensis TaxID=700274 RepID=UPI00214C93BD|nr:excalibur calcium-binding domain-containing protein [Amycolatopsis roodepoortensis]UUV28353.1 excalibur calcium-binding domain-containing protein [Amycolatopsis roodepoortensis]
MHTGPSRDKRMPRWMMIVLAAFSVLFVLGAVFGKTPQPQQERPVAAESATPSTSTTPTSSTPAPSADRVTEVVDAGTIKVTGTGGEKVVRILGLTTPPNTNGCFATETLTWAKNTLAGQEVIIRSISDEAGVALASVSMVNGGDYATTALKAGYAKFASRAVEKTVGTALQAAEDTARAAGNGLWGPPCFGKIDAPPTSVAPPQQPVAAPPTTRAEPTTKKSTPPPAAAKPDPPKTVSYANCDAVRAAGAAPLYSHQPGYSRSLDRDGDGVACEPKK